MKRIVGRTLIAFGALCAVAGLTFSGGIAQASPTVQAQAAASKPTITIALHMRGSGTRTGPLASIEICDAGGYAVNTGGTQLYAEGWVTCPEADFTVFDEFYFYSYGRLYTDSSGYGNTENGFFGDATFASGGSVHHRSVEWCVSIGTRDGYLGSGCFFIATNI